MTPQNDSLEMKKFLLSKKRQLFFEKHLFIWNLIIAGFFCFIGYFIAAHEVSAADYYKYYIMYQYPITSWYSIGPYFYYSPFFYVLFYPFQFISFTWYLVIGTVVYIIGVIIICRKIDFKFQFILQFVLWIQFWQIFGYGNIDLYLFTSVIIIWFYPNSDFFKGFLLGILCFKGTVGLTLPFFLWKTQKRKYFLIGFTLGLIVNYGWLLLWPPIIPTFFHHILLEDHNIGPIYLSGLQYPWLIGIVGLFTNEYIHQLKNKIQKSENTFIEPKNSE